MRKTFWIIPVLFLLTSLGSTAAHADSKYNFTISGSFIISSGTITVSTTGTPGVDNVTGITGTITYTINGPFSGVMTGLGPGSYDANNPTINPVPGGTIISDNLFTQPPSPSPAPVLQPFPSLTIAGYRLPLMILAASSIYLPPALDTMCSVSMRAARSHSGPPPSPLLPSPSPARPSSVLPE
jgi:hypothetical protein